MNTVHLYCTTLNQEMDITNSTNCASNKYNWPLISQPKKGTALIQLLLLRLGT